MIEPTMNYYTFHLAKERHSSVGSFLAGTPQPLASMERYLWTRFDRVQVVLERQHKQAG
jgi:hypothetical protein